MTNLITAQTNSNPTPIAAKKITSKEGRKSIGVIAAPDYLPKYSISKTLQEKDEFRKNIIYQNAQAKQSRKNNIVKVFIATLAAAGMVFFMKNKSLK